MNKENNQKIFAFRWDIDHLFCLEKGVPNILEICRKNKVKCSFYINLGRSMNLGEWFLKSPGKTIKKGTDNNSINLIKKIGLKEILKGLTINRNVGMARVDILKRIVDEGHELGLHGIFDHLLWSRGLNKLNKEYLDQEIQKAVDWFQKNLDFKPKGFSAPGFKWNANSLEIIDKYFKYSGDIFGEKPFWVRSQGKTLKHLEIPVTICGPKTVPLIEYLTAKGYSEDEITDKIKKEIDNNQFAIIYGHPCFEGLNSNILNKIFNFVNNNGYQVLTLEEIYEKFHNDKSLAVRSL